MRMPPRRRLPRLGIAQQIERQAAPPLGKMKVAPIGAIARGGKQPRHLHHPGEETAEGRLGEEQGHVLLGLGAGV